MNDPPHPAFFPQPKDLSPDGQHRAVVEETIGPVVPLYETLF
jgi:hypothetical protein